MIEIPLVGSPCVAISFYATFHYIYQVFSLKKNHAVKLLIRDYIFVNIGSAICLGETGIQCTLPKYMNFEPSLYKYVSVALQKNQTQYCLFHGHGSPFQVHSPAD